MRVPPEELDALVAASLAESRANPSRFRVEIFRLALLGYGYLAILIATALAAFARATWVIVEGQPGLTPAAAVFVVSGVFLQATLRALRVPTTTPAGVVVKPVDTPPLFEEIDRQRAVTGAPRLHRVLVTPELNAAVTHRPRLGWLGWNRRYLLLGLPLLQLMPADAAHDPRARDELSSAICRDDTAASPPGSTTCGFAGPGWMRSSTTSVARTCSSRVSCGGSHRGSLPPHSYCAARRKPRRMPSPSRRADPPQRRGR